MTKRQLGGSDNVAGFGRGTPEAYMQLQRHCERLNAMTGPEFWFVGTREMVNEQGIRVVERFVASRPRNAKPEVPYCTPAEARQILREHPSSFARVMLAAIEARDRQ